MKPVSTNTQNMENSILGLPDGDESQQLWRDKEREEGRGLNWSGFSQPVNLTKITNRHFFLRRYLYKCRMKTYKVSVYKDLI